jgi:hypothetical protein
MSERGLLSWLNPQRQCVVGKVVVQVDQAWHHQRAADVNDWCGL